MPKSYFTIGFFLSFLLTTGALQWSQVPEYPQELWGVLGLLGVLFLFVAILGHLGAPIRPSFALLLLTLLVGSSLSFLRVSQTTHVTTVDSVESFARTYEEVRQLKRLPSMTFHGFIISEPDKRPMKTKYTVEVDGVRVWARAGAGKDEVVAVSGKVLITDYSFYPPHNYGDEVLITGILQQPGQIENFHYDRFLSRYDVYSVMYRAQIETISKGNGSAFFAYLYDLKNQFESQLNRLYPEPHASFMAGLLTGSRRGIPEHLLKDFQTTGLTHIIAISGYNISIVIAIIGSFLFFLPLRFRFIPSVIAIVCFTLFVGASPSVVRAAIMGALGLFALRVGRQSHSFIAILLTGALMVGWNPKFLWYDAGFQLSFLSVLGLAYLAPLLDRVFASVPHTLGLRESLQMTIAAQLAAVPLIVILFGQFSLVAPLANVLVVPLPLSGGHAKAQKEV